jgi:hypothetical protein
VLFIHLILFKTAFALRRPKAEFPNGSLIFWRRGRSSDHLIEVQKFFALLISTEQTFCRLKEQIDNE